MEVTHISLISDKIENTMCLALASDLHNRNAKKVLRELDAASPDLILMPGDIFDYQPLPGETEQRDSLLFLRECAKLAPSWLSLGNHEWEAEDHLRSLVKESGVTLLDDQMERVGVRGNSLCIGGLSTPCARAGRYSRFYTPDPNVVFLDRFANMDGYKILLCHHPEFYPRVIANRTVDLILAGHAHGGQIRFGKQGLFAPGQGFFPKYTSGLYDDRLVVSRGLGNHTPIPRLWNRFQLIIIQIFPKD